MVVLVREGVYPHSTEVSANLRTLVINGGRLRIRHAHALARGRCGVLSCNDDMYIRLNSRIAHSSWRTCTYRKAKNVPSRCTCRRLYVAVCICGAGCSAVPPDAATGTIVAPARTAFRHSPPDHHHPLSVFAGAHPPHLCAQIRQLTASEATRARNTRTAGVTGSARTHTASRAQFTHPRCRSRDEAYLASASSDGPTALNLLASYHRPPGDDPYGSPSDFTLPTKPRRTRRPWRAAFPHFSRAPTRARWRRQTLP